MHVGIGGGPPPPSSAGAGPGRPTTVSAITHADAMSVTTTDRHARSPATVMRATILSLVVIRLVPPKGRDKTIEGRPARRERIEQNSNRRHASDTSDLRSPRTQLHVQILDGVSKAQTGAGRSGSAR
jgi:hypothetical protein